MDELKEHRNGSNARSAANHGFVKAGKKRMEVSFLLEEGKSWSGTAAILPELRARDLAGQSA